MALAFIIGALPSAHFAACTMACTPLHAYWGRVLSPVRRAALPAYRRVPSATMATRVGGDSIALSTTIDVLIIPVLSDNFSYLIHDKSSNTAAVVDPVEPEKVLRVARSLHASITTALTTHHHWDHAGGNKRLKALLPDIEIIGSAYEEAEAVTTRMKAGEQRSLKGGMLSFRALRTPCHTQGHICFLTETDTPALFSGDTLFVGGCGKFFEGSAQDMQTSLNETLAALPEETLIFCGHEYTVSNLKFAKSVDPDNEVLNDKLEWAKERVAIGVPTVPSTIGQEKAFNPFMRTTVPALANAVSMSVKDPVAVMKALREAKNSFRP